MRFIYVYPDTPCNASASRLHPNHAQLSRLASMHLQLKSNKHAKLVLRANGFSSSDATVAALRARIDEIADRAIVDPTAGGNPIPLTAEGAKAIFRAALKG